MTETNYIYCAMRRYGCEVRRYKLVKLTANTVRYDNGHGYEQRCNLLSEWRAFFPTFEEAKSFQIEEAKRYLSNAEARLAVAQKTLRDAMNLKEEDSE